VEKFHLSEMVVPKVIDTIMSENILNKMVPPKLKRKLSLQLEEKYAMLEFQPEAKKMILNDKLLSSKKNIPITKSLKILEAELTSRGKDLKPFWNTQSKENSKKWWLPTKTDFVVSDLTSLNGSLKSFPEAKSWFSTKVTVPQNKKLLPTSSLYLPFSQQESMDLENIKQKLKKTQKLEIKKPKSVLKNKSVRIYPTKDQEKILISWFGMFRWFYNRTIDYTKQHKNYDFYNVRNNMRTNSKYDIPDWCEHTISPRIITGAIQDCCKSWKTSFSHKNLKLINTFDLKYKSKKDLSQSFFLEKSCFTNKGILPTFKLGKIKGVYKRRKINLEDIKIDHDCRLTCQNNKYYIHIPTDVFQDENQVFGSIISLDSGVRTFQTGYSIDNHTVELGVNCIDEFKTNLKNIDSCISFASNCGKKRKRLLFNKVKRINLKIRNKIDDLHWKTIKYLTSNYEYVIISDFQTQQLLKTKLNSKSKRMLCILRHYNFKQRLKYKSQITGTKVHFVDESYTSKTCCSCGVLNHNLGSNKTFKCGDCGLKIDRDINGARNILNKNWEVLSTELHVG